MLFELLFDFVNYYNKSPLEPVGSVAPKLDEKDNHNWLTKSSDKSLSLLCPAQAYPMPAYR